MQLSAKELAQLLNGSVEGNSDVTVNRPSKIEEGGEGTISFLGNPKYESYAYTTTASILLVNQNFQPQEPITPTLIRVDNVYESIALLLEKFNVGNNTYQGISDNAIIHESASIGENTSVGDQVIIENDAIIGKNCVFHPQVFIGHHVKIGDNVTLFPGVRIMHSCSIGDNCTVYANTVIGSDGFGYALKEDGRYEKIAQIGNVIIEDNVEIGSNTTIDRATMGSTIIRRGVKLDNLIQVAHNVEIGENTVIAAQAGIAGSTKIGKNCRIGGQVGFAGHLTIADGTQIQAQSGLASSVNEPNTAIFGSPAIGYKDYIRAYAVFKKLPDLYKKISQLEKRLKEQQSKPM